MNSPYRTNQHTYCTTQNINNINNTNEITGHLRSYREDLRLVFRTRKRIIDQNAILVASLSKDWLRASMWCRELQMAPRRLTSLRDQKKNHRLECYLLEDWLKASMWCGQSQMALVRTVLSSPELLSLLSLLLLLLLRLLLLLCPLIAQILGDHN